MLIAMECLWVRYVFVGLKARGYAPSALIGDGWGTRTVGADAVYGALGFFAARILADGAKLAIGSGDANRHGWSTSSSANSVSMTRQ